jgi:hypothetical protein
MKRIRPQDLFQRSVLGSSSCISIYLNDLSKLETQLLEVTRLTAGDLTISQLKALVDPLRRFKNSRRWASLKGPVAFFLSRDFAGYVTLPFATKDLVVVALSFHVKPLIKWMEREKPYFVIQVQDKEACLFQGSFKGLSVLQKFAFESPEKAGLILQGLDKTLYSLIRGTRFPVLIYGPQPIAEKIYRKARFKKLIALPFQTIAEDVGQSELHRHSVQALEPHHQRIESLEIEKYWTAKMEGRTSCNLQEIVHLALDGKVRHLFINEKMNIWGHINFYNGKLTYHPNQRNSMDDDVLDDLAELVLYHKGRVTVLSGDRMPESHAAAAILTEPLTDALTKVDRPPVRRAALSVL